MDIDLLLFTLKESCNYSAFSSEGDSLGRVEGSSDQRDLWYKYPSLTSLYNAVNAVLFDDSPT